MSRSSTRTTSVTDVVSLKAAREEAYTQFKEHQVVGRLTKQLSKLSDQLLVSLWNTCDLQSDAALIAVGGFGRGALFPYSDIDILILLPEDKKYFEEVLASKIEKFVALCWDTGLEIGSSVRTVEECISEAEQDITVRTSLLESRLICGKKVLFKEFEAAYEKALDPKTFFQAKLAEQIQRHYKYQDTPYSLEPNCK
ncbi:MAG: bifunctional uridylyltransferase/uridylyl-removing protein, partial [Polynucleobacter sp. 24-46-87]